MKNELNNLEFWKELLEAFLKNNGTGHFCHIYPPFDLHWQQYNHEIRVLGKQFINQHPVYKNWGIDNLEMDEDLLFIVKSGIKPLTGKSVLNTEGNRKVRIEFINWNINRLKQ